MKSSKMKLCVPQLIPAAQYVRMSKDFQQYSIENQTASISEYAVRNGFDVVKTYTDAGRSGVVLKSRAGLTSLLADVVKGGVEFKTVLVYDVSRWGRFQDTDEAAHYEFLCKQAGVPIRYCAEPFANDGTMSSTILKALKRTMAAEFSRELGEKVYIGQKRLAQLGFRMGGYAGFGLRRALISKDGKRRQTLKKGEHKSLTTDRIILVPGPRKEVECVRAMYRLKLTEHLSDAGIARRLNEMGFTFLRGKPWTHNRIRPVLTALKYCGTNLYNRTSRRLHAPSILRPREEWTIEPRAFQAIIAPEAFEATQKVMQDRKERTSPKELIRSLKKLLRTKGKLTQNLIEDAEGYPAVSTYFHQLGNFRAIYKQVGYLPAPGTFSRSDSREITIGIREKLFAQIQATFPHRVALFKLPRHKRQLMLVDGQLSVSIVICPSFRTPRGQSRWTFVPTPHEIGFMTLLCRLDDANREIEFFDLCTAITKEKSCRLAGDLKQLGKSHKLNHLAELCDAVQLIESCREVTEL
jgi:DNA invertase Pin-like site-specific DNA recombinase